MLQPIPKHVFPAYPTVGGTSGLIQQLLASFVVLQPVVEVGIIGVDGARPARTRNFLAHPCKT